jgi:hypothetical protein
MRQRTAVLTAVAGGDLAVLLGWATQVAAAGRVVAHPRGELARVGADAALGTVTGGALWCAAVWLALGLAAAAAARLPGWGGRWAATVSRALLPRAVRGLVAGGAGIGVLLAPAAALAATHTSTPTGSTATPSPAWPVQAPTTSAPAWPVQAPTTPAPDAEQAPGGHHVTVRPGDSLWSIAARSIGPRACAPKIAAGWPRWFRENRAVIGDDPALIRPGLELRAPAPTPSAEEAAP